MMTLRYLLILSFCLLLSPFAKAQHVPSYIPLPGLAAWYPFSGNAVDSSGNGNNATVNGPTLAADRFGAVRSAYSFNGTGNYMKVPASTNSQLDIRNNNYTITAWFKANFLANGNMWILNRALPPLSTVQYGLLISSGNIQAQRSAGSGTTGTSYSLAGLDTAAWHFVAETFDTLRGFSIFLDGTLVTQSAQIGTLSGATSMFSNFIGSYDGNSGYFKGLLDDIGVWSRALDYCEITKIYYASAAIITQQPGNSTATVGSSTTFTIGDVSNAATYQWQADTGTGFFNLSNGGHYSGVTTKTLTISGAIMAMNGYSYRCIRNGGGCLDNSAAGVLRVQLPTGVSQTGNKTEWSLYPNPNKGAFTLSAIGVQGGSEALADVTDMAGRSIQQQRIMLANGKASVDFGRRLTPGIYFLKLSFGGEQKVLRFSTIE